MRRRAALGVGALALVLAACGSSPTTLDQAATEAAVAEAVASSPSLDGLEVGAADVRCPAEVLVEAGESFECTVSLGERGELEVAVEVTDDDGTLDVVPQAALIDPVVAAEQLKATLRSEFGRSFQVDCGDDPAELRAEGDTFTCRARDKTSRRSVTVTVVDAAGTLSFEVADPS